jgi:lysozyme
MSLPPGAPARDRWLDLADEARAKTREALANGDRRMAGLWDEHERTLLRNAYEDVPFRDAAPPTAGTPRSGFDPSPAFPSRGIQIASAGNNPSIIGEFLMAAGDRVTDPITVIGKPDEVDQLQRRSPKTMSTGDAGLNMITGEEEFRPEVYPDPGGRGTIGYGHLVKKGEEKVYPKGTVIDKAKGREILQADLGDAEAAIRRLAQVDLSQNQFDALVSFAYNVGPVAFAKSTLLKKLNNGDYEGAAQEFSKWIWIADRKTGEKTKSDGLIRRREKEQKLFQTPRIEIVGDVPKISFVTDRHTIFPSRARHSRGRRTAPRARQDDVPRLAARERVCGRQQREYPPYAEKHHLRRPDDLRAALSPGSRDGQARTGLAYAGLLAVRGDQPAAGGRRRSG